jgi:predicted secreted protein
MEALPVINPKLVSKSLAPKNFAAGMEFLMTVLVSAVAGLLAFLLVSVVAHILGLSGS